MADEKLRGHCPTCAGERFADVVASHEERWTDGYVDGCITHRILKCRGCEAVYVQKGETCSEDDHHYQDEHGEWFTEYPERKTYWPAATTTKEPDWAYVFAVDNDLSNLFRELYVALNSELPVLAAIGIRTVFDRASELLGINSSLPFARKLKELEAQGRIGADEREHLLVLTDAGGAAAHRGWRPKPEQLDTLVSTLEAFLYRTMVLGDALKTLKAAVPVKQKSAPKIPVEPKDRGAIDGDQLGKR
jgi:hypothetical protein